MGESTKIGFRNSLRMNTMHGLTKFYSKTKSRRLRILTHYAILGIFFVSIVLKHKPTSIRKKTSEIKFIVSEVMSWVRK